ncbi:MAG: hypothetical protein LBK46_07230 [Oscillospiraceae bacterium]|jgi:hypothetical protein|nr:hypothetical protein [Oscillospiraceae bacterium]
MNAHINSEILGKVEYLRSKADVNYEEALSMLERFDGDLTRVLIELERANRIHNSPPYHGCGYTHQREGFGVDKNAPHRRHRNPFERVVHVLFHNHLQVTRNDEIIINMPVMFYVVFLIFSPRLTIAGIVAMLLFGCHIGVKKVAHSITQQDVAQFARNAAENVHNTINNISDNIRKGFDSDDKDEGGPGEGGEFTVE